MKQLALALMFWGSAACLFAQREGATAEAARPIKPEGILRSIENADAANSKEPFAVTRRDRSAPVQMTFIHCQALGVQRERDQWWVLPISAPGSEIDANSGLWILPLDARSQDRSWYIELHAGDAKAEMTDAGLNVQLRADSFTLTRSEARPHSDPFNHRFSIKLGDGDELENALAGFYWGTMLPSVVEKTMAAHYPYSDGYVLSTLKVSAYAGSYPAVDHEFQIKGRLAMGSPADLDIVRRMIELQFKLMDDDPEHLARAPTSVQPDGRREYHVRRNSKDDRQNAAMFPLTANIEVIEEAWHYYEATKDAAWLQSHIGNLERSAAWTLASVDQYGRVWSDVYYEDQVIKDGRETQAQAFTAYTFGLLANIESELNRQDQAVHYAKISKDIARALIEPLPIGYWDDKNQRFIDWVDRDGKVHDHLHLLANELPVMFGYATKTQSEAVQRFVAVNSKQFERFPSFLSADIAAYDNAEIGSGGPYDLSAAGRYWYWDAAFRESQQQNSLLFDQLKTVAAEGAKNNYFMGERYDMDYVYYVDGKNAHGAEKYYEYPNVFAAVLIAKLVGLTIPADADVSVAPHLSGYGSVEFATPSYALQYTYNEQGFLLKNLADKPRRFTVDLSSLGHAGTHYQSMERTNSATVSNATTITIAPHAEARWTTAR